jgi:hypothetical protein
MATDPERADEISADTRMIVAQARLRAAEALMGAGLAGLAADALRTPRADMSATEIRDLAVTALERAQQVSYLLGRLAGLAGDDEQP